MLRLIGNVIWFVTGGLTMGLAWWLCSLVAFVSIVGIPWGRACFVIGKFSFFPFGYDAISRDLVNKKDDIGTGILGTVGNIIWVILAGWWLALGHVFWGIVCAISIIGIPFGLQHLKLAGLALFPIGKMIVTVEEARLIYNELAKQSLSDKRDFS